MQFSTQGVVHLYYTRL